MFDLERLFAPPRANPLAAITRLLDIRAEGAGMPVSVNLRITSGRDARSARPGSKHDMRLRRHELRKRSPSAGRS